MMAIYGMIQICVMRSNTIFRNWYTQTWSRWNILLKGITQDAVLLVHVGASYVNMAEISPLTDWTQTKMAAILQTAYTYRKAASHDFGNLYKLMR